MDGVVRASALERKAATTSNAYDLLGEAVPIKDPSGKKSKSAKRREKKKVSSTHSDTKKKDHAADNLAPTQRHVDPHHHRFDKAVVEQAMAMGFTETKVVEALERMDDKGYDTSDVNALLDRLTCTDDWHTKDKSSSDDTKATSVSKSKKSPKKGNDVSANGTASAVPLEASVHSTGLDYSLPAGNNITFGSFDPVGMATQAGPAAPTHGTLHKTHSQEKPHREKQHQDNKRKGKNSGSQRPHTKGKPNTAEELSRDLLYASSVAHQGSDARVTLWESWLNLMSSSQTWPSEETGEKVKFIDVFIASGAFRSMIRGVVTHPAASDRERLALETISSRVLDADNDLTASLLAGVTSIAHGLEYAKPETSAVVADAVAENMTYFQKMTSENSAFEKELMDLEESIESKLSAGSPSDELLPLYERQKSLMPKLLSAVLSPSDVEDAYTGTVQRLDEHILKLGRSQDKLVQDKMNVQKQRQDLEHNKLEEYKAVQQTLSQLQEETGILLARKGELETELRMVNAKIEENTSQLMNMESLSSDDIHANRINSLVEDERAVVQQLALQRDDYDRLQKVRQYLTATFSTLREKAEARRGTLERILEAGSERYMSSLRVSVKENMQEVQVSHDRLRLVKRKIAQYQDELNEVVDIPGVALPLQTTIAQMKEAEVSLAAQVIKAGEKAEGMKKEIADMSFGKRQESLVGVLATLDEIISIAQEAASTNTSG